LHVLCTVVTFGSITPCYLLQMQINTESYWKASLRPVTCRVYQLCRVDPSCVLPLAVCILMLPMLAVAAEHVQLTTTYHVNPVNQCGHITFHHPPLLLPSLTNVLPATVLQNRGVSLNIGYSSHSLSQFGIQHVFSSLDLRVYSSKGRRVVVLLLLLSGDIELNPGPVGKCLDWNTYIRLFVLFYSSSYNCMIDLVILIRFGERWEGMTLTPLGSHLVADPLSVTPWSVVDKGGAVAWLDLAVWFIGISSSTY